MELTLYKAHRTDGNGEVEGMPTFDFKYIFNENQLDSADNYEIIPETLSIYTGLTAEWFNEGVDKRIWSGDVFEAENIIRRKITVKVIYKNGAFYVVRVDDEEMEELLFNFINNNVYTKIGSIHDQKEGK